MKIEQLNIKLAMGNVIPTLILTICFVLVCNYGYAQESKAEGRIVDSQGNPIVGATVIIEGAVTGVVANVDGEFELPVNNDDVLVISFMGYEQKRIKVGATRSFEIMMLDNTTQLDEVVVVGYGAQKKVSVVGAISQLSSDDILSTPSANISQAIAGKIPGVVTTQSSGAPGADDMQIYIRGRASFAGDNQPLILVDGVEREFSQIAPDDIQSISTLKDASATAVYGVRGANGVMLITTKRGKEMKPTVSLTANWQFQSPTRRDTYLNSYDSALLLEEALSNDGLPSQFSSSDLDMYRRSVEGSLSGVDQSLYPNVDWYDTVLRNTAPAQRYNVNVQGGTERLKYFISTEYYNQEGLLKNFSQDPYGNKSNTSYSRYAFRANLDFLLTRDLTMGVNFGTRFEDRRGPNATESEIFYELNHTPGWLFPVAYTIDPGDGVRDLYGGSSQYQNNIVGRLAEGGFYRATNTISETNFSLNYKMDWLLSGLSAKAMASFDYDGYYNRKFTANFATYELNDRDNYNSLGAYNQFNTDTELTYAGDDQTVSHKLYMEYTLNWVRSFDKHDVSAMVLYNQNDYRFQSELARRYQGLVGRATYGYDNRYLAEVNFGYNGSENFMKGNRFGFFPSFSLGWRLENEAFMEEARDWLNSLKIRASYGQVGNDHYSINDVDQRFLYEESWIQLPNDYYFGTTGQTGIYERLYPNYGVTWERAHKYNVGVDFGFWNGMLNGAIDVFYEKRDNILTSYLSRPQWVGVDLAAGNLGKTTNKGFEIELRHANRIGKDLLYNIGVTYSRARNEIIGMDEPQGMTDYRKREGHSINQYFGLVADGFITSADVASGNLPVSSFGSAGVGDLKYRDLNNDGFIDERDQAAIGFSDIPEDTFAVSLGINYKNIGFNVMFQGVGRVSRYYDAEAMYAFVDGGKVKEHHLDRWNPSQSESYNLSNAKYPRLHYDGNGDHNQRLNSFFLKDGSYVRLKNIELSYSLPEKWVSKVLMSSCRIYVNANNLITWDHLDGLSDPESQGSNRYPIMKAVNIGANIKF